MHSDAYTQMVRLLDRLALAGAEVLDVGSLDVNGSYRALVEDRGWMYTGLDMIEGDNVDVVTGDPYHYPFADASFDVVMSGSTMEHVQAVWLWVPELVRVLRPNGSLVIITHTQWPYHAYPLDCWRILPDGMRYLFDLTGQLERYDICMYNATDISATAHKKVTR